MPSVRYAKKSGVWVPREYVHSPGSIPSGRDSLVSGVHKPNSLANSGPYSISSWTDVHPNPGEYWINITGPGPDNGYWKGIRYWGQVRVAQGLPDWLVKFDQCHVIGQAWDSVGSTPPNTSSPAPDPGFVRCYGTTPSKTEWKDCLFDPMPWITEGGKTKLSPYSMGFHGANFRCYRSNLLNIQDPFNLVGPNGLNATALANQETLIQQNWIHKGYYTNDVYPPADGQPHSDLIQFNTGRNYTIRGNYIGGVRNMTGFLTWPGGTNLGDDCYAAGIMIGQEVDNSDTNRLEYILIEDNWIEGCAHGINHAYKPAWPNTFSTTTIRNNKFKTRTGSNWGTSLRGDGPGTPPRSQSTGAGSYIIRALAITSSYSNNTNEDTGALVPIANGG